MLSGQELNWVMMHGGSGGNIGGIRSGDEFSYLTKLCASINCDSRFLFLRLPWGPAPSAKAYNNQQTTYAIGLQLVFLDHKNLYNHLGHNALMNHCARWSPVAMVVPPTQSIGGNNNGTYILIPI
jgi:hypothetical protein